MASFKAILSYNPEQLLQLLYGLNTSKIEKDENAEAIAKQLQLRKAQLICAVGFNQHLPGIQEIPPVLGYVDYNALIDDRNRYFTTDIYELLTLDNILSIYTAMRDGPDIHRVMGYILATRLSNIEKQIDATVNPLIINKYKEEVRNIYSNKIVDIDFVENRLEQVESGFRALLNEVVLIAENKIIPIGDIFFRDMILPQEKKKLLGKGLIPKPLIELRLSDPNIPAAERKILRRYIKSTF